MSRRVDEINTARVALAWRLIGDNTPIGVGSLWGMLGLAYAMASPLAQKELHNVLGLGSFNDIVASHNDERVLALVAVNRAHEVLHNQKDLLQKFTQLRAHVVRAGTTVASDMFELVQRHLGVTYDMPKDAFDDIIIALIGIDVMKVEWPMQFCQTHQTFLTRHGTRRPVPMCSGTRTILIGVTSTYDLARLQCKTEGEYVILALPHDKDPSRDHPPPDMRNVVWKWQEVDLLFPKFSATSDLMRLRTRLQPCLPTLFDMAKGPFEGTLPTSEMGEPSCIDEVFHKATFAMDAKGVEAKAATVGTIRCRSISVKKKHYTFCCDRPFTALLMRAGLVEFMIKVTDPH